MKNRLILLFASIIAIILLAWHFSHAQTFWNGGYPCGQAISLNGTDQYLSIADNAGSLDQTLDVETDDFMHSFAVNYTTLASNNVFNKTSGYGAPSTGYGYLGDSGTHIVVYLQDGSTLRNMTCNAIINDGRWHQIVCIVDRSGRMYLFVDGFFDGSSYIATMTGSLSNTQSFIIGKHPTGAVYLQGYEDIPRAYRFGIDGLYVTGTGVSDLVIKVGSSSGPVLYSEVTGDGGSVAAPVGLIPLMYKSPSKSLTQLGFASIDQAARTELQANGNCESGNPPTSWLVGGNQTLSASTEHDGGSGSQSSRSTITGAGTYVSLYNLKSSGTYSKDVYYAISFWARASENSSCSVQLWTPPSPHDEMGTVSITTSWQLFTIVNKAITLSTNDRVVFKVDSKTTGFWLDVDDCSIRRIGCVAEWNLNNALTDGSGNGLTLTNNESATFVTSKIEALGSVLRSDGSISIHRSVQ